MSTRDDIISIKNGLITLGNAIDNLSVHAEDSGQIVNSAKTINFQGKDHNSIYGKGLQWSGMGNTKMLHLQGEPNSCLLYTSPSPRDLSTSRMPSSA